MAILCYLCTQNFKYKVTMKKIVFLIAILMASCDDGTSHKSDNPKKTKEEVVKTPVLTEVQTTPEHIYGESYNYVKVYTFEEDGCKYIVASSTTHDFRGGTSVALVHAASCTNPIHNK